MKQALVGVAVALVAAFVYGVAAVLLSYMTDRSSDIAPEGGWLHLILTVPLYMVLLSSPLTVLLGAGLGSVLPRLPRHLPLVTSLLAATAIGFVATLLLFGAIKPTPESASALSRFGSGLKEAVFAGVASAAFTFSYRAGP